MRNIKGITLRDIWRAKKRIEPYSAKTPLLYSHALSKITGANIYLKLENLQDIGAFKVRGAANMMLTLTDEQKGKGVFAFSTGNHGIAVAYMADKLHIHATICMSKHVDPAKVAAISRWKPTILQQWESQDEAASYCYEMEKQKGITVIPPFDHKEIICGQGTIALEILEELPDVDMVVAPVSGGGLLAGIAIGMKLADSAIQLVGVSQQNAAAMAESLKNGRPIEVTEEPTLADSLLGGIGLYNQFTFDIVKSYVDRVEKVTEEEIAQAIQFLMKSNQLIIEGASATGIAFALKGQKMKAGSNVAVIVTGRSISWETVKKVVSMDI